LVGDGNRIVRGVCAPDAPPEVAGDKLCVVWEKKALKDLHPSAPVLAEIGSLAGRDGVELARPRAALVKILPLFDRRRGRESGIHPTAVVDEGAVLGADVSVGPCCVVSRGAVLGDRVCLQANCFVGEGVSIGNDTVIEASVSILDFSSIGERVTVHCGTAIGCDGFGFIPMGDGHWERIPQIGVVVIEDDVEIGPNSSLDRATFGETRIRRGAKIGAHVHVAHNSDVGAGSVLVGFIALGGSSKVGRGCVLAGMVGVSDHVVIGDQVTVAGRSGVTKDIAGGQIISGYPAQEHRAENRFQASLRRVAEYERRIKDLEQAIAELKRSDAGEP
jgi:UDP-3-O-[3-hydroxymyristoyl] glucosamine N-acyltransferase